MKIDYKVTTIILSIIIVLWIVWGSFGYGMMGYGMHSRLNVMMGRGSNSDCVAWANATDGGREAGSYNEHCNKVLSKGMHMMGNGQEMSNKK